MSTIMNVYGANYGSVVNGNNSNAIYSPYQVQNYNTQNLPGTVNSMFPNYNSQYGQYQTPGFNTQSLLGNQNLMAPNFNSQFAQQPQAGNLNQAGGGNNMMMQLLTMLMSLFSQKGLQGQTANAGAANNPLNYNNAGQANNQNTDLLSLLQNFAGNDAGTNDVTETNTDNTATNDLTEYNTDDTDFSDKLQNVFNHKNDGTNVVSTADNLINNKNIENLFLVANENFDTQNINNAGNIGNIYILDKNQSGLFKDLLKTDDKTKIKEDHEIKGEKTNKHHKKDDVKDQPVVDVKPAIEADADTKVKETEVKKTDDTKTEVKTDAVVDVKPAIEA